MCELGEKKRLTVNIAFFFPPFILFLHIQAVVAMKNKWHLLKWYPQRQSPSDTQPANTEFNLPSLILFSHGPDSMRLIFKIQYIYILI